MAVLLRLISVLLDSERLCGPGDCFYLSLLSAMHSSWRAKGNLLGSYGVCWVALSLLWLFLMLFEGWRIHVAFYPIGSCKVVSSLFAGQQLFIFFHCSSVIFCPLLSLPFIHFVMLYNFFPSFSVFKAAVLSPASLYAFQFYSKELRFCMLQLLMIFFEGCSSALVLFSLRSSWGVCKFFFNQYGQYPHLPFSWYGLSGSLQSVSSSSLDISEEYVSPVSKKTPAGFLVNCISSEDRDGLFQPTTFELIMKYWFMPLWSLPLSCLPTFVHTRYCPVHILCAEGQVLSGGSVPSWVEVRGVMSITEEDYAIVILSVFYLITSLICHCIPPALWVTVADCD